MTDPPDDLPIPPPPGQPGVNRYGQRGALTPELQDKIVRIVRAGNYLKVAAQYNGIGESTLRLWLQRGRAAAALRDQGQEVPEVDARYLSFLEAITQSETVAEVAAVTHWRAAFADDWRAARDFLVRKNPASWAATTRITLSQEEADRRIDAAAEQVLIAVGVDTDQLGEEHLMPGEADTLDGLDLDTDDDWDDSDDA